MAVGSGIPYNQHTGNGVTVTFAYGFTLLDADDLVVTLDDVVSTAFTVAGIGDAAGGSITFTAAPANGVDVLLHRVIGLERLTDYQTNGDLQAATVNNDFDRLWQALQQVDDTSSRTVRAPFPETLAELPVAASRLDRLVAFDIATGEVEVTNFTQTQLASAVAAAYAAGSTADAVTFIQSGTGAVSRSIQEARRDICFAEDFGAVGDGVTDDRAAIQAALDAHKTVCLRGDNDYKIGAALAFNDYNRLVGMGASTRIVWSFNGAAITGKAVTPAAGTNVRRYYGGAAFLTLYGPGVGLASGIALDLRGCTGFKFFDILIQNVYLSVRQGDGYSTYYNRFFGVDSSTVNTGFLNTTLANSNTVFGGRVNDCVTGTSDSDCSGNTYSAMEIEAFTGIAHKTTGAATQFIRWMCSRIENVPTVGKGFEINANAQDSQIISPQLIGLTTDIDNTGIRTQVIGASEYFLLAGGTRIKKFLRVTVTRDVANLAAGAFRQDGPITVTGVEVGDGLSVVLPAAWPTNIMVGAPIVTAANTVYLPMHNPSGGGVDPASGDFVFSITDFS